MTQNEVNFLQEALGSKCTQLLEEIVENNNFVQNAKAQSTTQPKETKKSTKKENK